MGLTDAPTQYPVHDLSHPDLSHPPADPKDPYNPHGTLANALTKQYQRQYAEVLAKLGAEILKKFASQRHDRTQIVKKDLTVTEVGEGGLKPRFEGGRFKNDRMTEEITVKVGDIALIVHWHGGWVPLSQFPSKETDIPLIMRYQKQMLFGSELYKSHDSALLITPNGNQSPSEQVVQMQYGR